MPARRLAHVPVLLVLVADLVAAHRATNPGLSVADLYPPMPSIEALRGREGRVAADGYALRPNAGMVYRLPDIRGDSPLKMDRQRRAYEAFSDADPIYYRPIRDWSHPTLDRLGVRWVLTGPDRPPPVAGWPAVYRGEDARVYERPGALPLVRFASPPAAPGSSGTVAAVEQESGRWVVEWESPGPDLLVVAESWDAGWRARDETGRSLDVERAEELFLGVRVGPGKGTVELTYRPRGFEVGSLVTVLSLASFLVPLPGRRWRRLGG